MNPITTTQYLYVLENLDIYPPSLIAVIIAVIFGIVFIVSLRILFEIVAGASLVRHDHKLLEDKKKVLNDLILMKDIQTELENELEQATLKATFQG
jgi:hypothetical protein